MEKWKQDLDRYLTQEPEDGSFDWFEDTVEYFSDDFWEENEVWIIDNDLSFEWAGKLYNKYYKPQRAAEIIERAFKIYCK
jgi:hypothetical protein